MFKITIKGSFDEKKLEHMRNDEINQYNKAQKSLEDLEETFNKHFYTMLVRKGFNPLEVKDALKPFYMGYDFDFKIIPEGAELVWDGHYWIDYKNETITNVMYKSFKMFKPFWFVPNAIKERIGAIRNPKLFFLPKVNEPTVRERHMQDLLEEVTQRFKKLDANCIIESVFRDEYAQ